MSQVVHQYQLQFDHPAVADETNNNNTIDKTIWKNLLFILKITYYSLTKYYLNNCTMYSIHQN